MYLKGVDSKAAKRFFKKVLKAQHTQTPRVIHVDQNAAHPPAIDGLKQEDVPVTIHLTPSHLSELRRKVGTGKLSTYCLDAALSCKIRYRVMPQQVRLCYVELGQALQQFALLESALTEESSVSSELLTQFSAALQMLRQAGLRLSTTEPKDATLDSPES